MEDGSILHSRLNEPEKLFKRPFEARLKECRPCILPNPYQQPHPGTIAIKLLTKFLQVGTHSYTVLRGKSLLCPPLPESNTSILSCLTQNSVSEIRFGTDAQRPSFRHHSSCKTQLRGSFLLEAKAGKDAFLLHFYSINVHPKQEFMYSIALSVLPVSRLSVGSWIPIT